MEHCAGQSSAIAEDVRTMTRELTATLFSVADTLRREADSAAADMATSRAEIETALQSVEQAHDAIRKQLTSAGDLSRDFAREMSAAVMALQFQDRVSQRVSHVVDALTYTHQALESARPQLSGRHRDLAERRRADIANQIHGMHTMAEERTAGTPVIVKPPAAAGDVELF
jgi:methyl-accepting chemotaxis protein